ncbi:MAG: biopolymer transporter ExbD [Bdellovibrionaceae bacterium]|jgi:biopolymer transport protein ExbD|nr:biopolymer transporter ExbD [Pseudobdellovibrionaceae bacterium]
MAGKSLDHDDAIAEINIVPFVDIILVVLIIFMVTTPLIMKPSINVNLPKAASGEESAPSKLNITITKTGELMLNGNPSSTEKIHDYSKMLVSKSSDAQAIISADKVVSHGMVVSIIDAVKSAGIKKFAITIDKK